MPTLQDAVDAIDRGEDAVARELLNSLLATDPALIDAWVWLATLAEARNDFAEQRHCLERITAIDPNNSEARRIRIRLQRADASSQPMAPAPSEVPPGDQPQPQSDVVEHELADEENDGAGTDADTRHVIRLAATPRLDKIGAPVWDWFFADERSLIGALPSLLKDFIDAGQAFGADTARLERLHTTVAEGNEEARRNLLVAVLRSGVEAATFLNRQESCGQAFWIANALYQAGKIVSFREKNNTPKMMERLLVIAADAAARLVPSSVAIDDLQMAIDRIITLAHSTRYVGRTFASVRPDLGIVEKIALDTIAADFDRRLREMVESDRPSINEYVSNNMPKLYRMRLSPEWLACRDAWEQAIIDAGYDDTLRSLKSLGLLVRVDQIGIILPDARDQIRMAADAGDYASIRKLLEPSEKELRNLLYKETQTALVFREPPSPTLRQQHREPWQRAMRTLRNHGPRAAMVKVSEIWQEDANNLDIRDWAAYLHAQDASKLQAERILTVIRDSRKADHNFTTSWNLAVIYSQRHEEAKAYELLLPLFHTHQTDERLIKVLLGLARSLNDHEGFLRLIPQSRTLMYHPIAFTLAVEINDDARAKSILTEMIARWEHQWDLPHVSALYRNEDELIAVVTSGMIAGQIEQVIAWLRARIAAAPAWIPNYLVLANVLEREHRDFDDAFQVLLEGCKRRRDDDPRRDAAYRDLLDLCRRAKRTDLEQRAYEFAKKARVSESVLSQFQVDSRVVKDRASDDETEPSQTPPPTKPPKVVTREEPNFTWITAKLARIRDADSFSKEQVALDDFSSMLSRYYPDTSVQIVPWLKDLSKITNQFAEAEPESSYNDRVVLYNRATAIERDLTRHMESGALPPDLVEVMTPYHEALKRVVSNLSRAAGVGPKVESTILNSFIAPDAPRTTVVVQLKNTTNGERTITDVVVELRAERNLAAVMPRQRLIRRLEAAQTVDINFTITLDATARSAAEVTFDMYVRSSVEGFLNVDQPIAQTKLPVRTLRAAINTDEIPKLFIDSSPLDQSSQLFHGRDTVMQRIRSSLYDGTQRERLFLDGIRRVGKSSIINFVPLNVPDVIIAVPLGTEGLGLQVPLDAAVVLWKIAKVIDDAFRARAITRPALPTPPTIDGCAAYFESVKAVTGYTPLLMVDEFQEMLKSIKETGRNAEVILDILRNALEKRFIYGLFTGSIRFSSLSTIVPHRIFGNITRLRVSFLEEPDVMAVLRAGFGQWVVATPGAVKSIFELTGGYPYIVQKFGSALVTLLNEEKRCIASSDDVERVASADLLSDDSIFEYWWPTDQLRRDEERAVELLFHHFPDATSVSIDDFLGRVERREVENLRKALQNLQSCEVLDSTGAGQLRFTAEIVRRWLHGHYHRAERRLRIPMQQEDSSLPAIVANTRPLLGHVGVYIDHENFVRSLARIRIARSSENEPAVRWFDRSLKQVLGEVEKRFGRIDQKVAVAFWDRQDEMRLQPSYTRRDFDVRTPERTGKGNEADFKLADEIRRSMAQAKLEGASLRDAIVITGDADFTNVISGLKNDGVNVHVWAAGASASQTLIGLVGPENVVMLDDICVT